MTVKYITISKAKEDYKVIITSNMEVDNEHTDKLRKNN